MVVGVLLGKVIGDNDKSCYVWGVVVGVIVGGVIGNYMDK